MALNCSVKTSLKGNAADMTAYDDDWDDDDDEKEEAAEPPSGGGRIRTIERENTE